MFYQALPSQLCYRVMTLPSQSNNQPSLLIALSFALEKSLVAYSTSPLARSQVAQDPQISFATSVTSIKANARLNSPIKSESTEKNSEKKVEILDKKKTNLSVAETVQSTIEVKSKSIEQTEDKWKNIAKIPQFRLLASQRQSKIQSLLQRKVEGWVIERPRRRVNRQIYNLL